jgi:hypothetical protein
VGDYDVLGGATNRHVAGHERLGYNLLDASAFGTEAYRPQGTRRLDTPEMERTAMRYFAILPAFCILAVVVGGFLAPVVGAPADSVWLKAVALSGKNDNLVPGLMKMHMQEVDKHGEPKDIEKYHEVWSALRLGEDGKVEYEMIKAIENGEDITEEEKAKAEEEKAREESEDGGEDEDSDSHQIEGYNPFDPESQERISFEVVGKGEIVGGKNTVVYEFTDHASDDVVINGKAWLEEDTGVPVKLEYIPDPLPKRVKRMVTTTEYEHIYPDSLVVKHMSVEMTGGILFIKKHFHMDMTFDQYWRLPKGYGEE